MVSCLLLIAAIAATATEPQEHYYHFVIDAVTSNEFSPDCEDLTSSFRYLFLVQDLSSPDSKPSMPGPTIEVSDQCYVDTHRYCMYVMILSFGAALSVACTSEGIDLHVSHKWRVNS